MTHASAVTAGTETARPATRQSSNSLIAPRALGHAALLGIAADLLLRDGVDGAGFPIWIALLAIAITSMTWRAHREVPRPATAWLLLAVLSACGLAWRDADRLEALDVLATGGALCMTAIALGDKRAGLLAEHCRDTLWASAAVLRRVAAGILPNIAETIHDVKHDAAWASRGRRSLRLVLLALGVLVVFGSLLRSADPIFASLVGMPDWELGVIASHVVVSAWFAWLVAGWANAALGSTVSHARAPTRFPFSLGRQDLAASLGVLNVLFGVFVVAQLGWLFGGERFLRARTGLTVAEYARHGFFEVVWVAALVIPLLVVSRSALVPERGVARRHTLFAVPLLFLLAGIIASAATRMQLYVHYYGLTVDRLYTLIFMTWLTAVLAWLAATVLRDRGRTFVAGVVGSGFALLAALNVAAPDAIVARFNARRAGVGIEGAAADLPHMTQLSAEAVDVAVEATLATPRPASDLLAGQREATARCQAADHLLAHWGPQSRAAAQTSDDLAWRRWNAGKGAAVRLVGANAASLRRVQHSACSGVPRAERRLSPS